MGGGEQGVARGAAGADGGSGNVMDVGYACGVQGCGGGGAKLGGGDDGWGGVGVAERELVL